jgi:hypothetical protein
MVMRVAGGTPQVEETPQVNVPVGNSELEKIDAELIAMWQQYRNKQIYENPVTLSEFFAQFTALFGYFYVIVNKDKLKTDAAVAKKTAEIYMEYGKASVTERDGVIRRAERAARSLNEYYLSQVAWAKGCVNEMQTLLRLMGDEAKMSGGSNV